MPRPARVSPDRILAAAAAEFSARGFSGARVDRIARRARINKAMLYYHFGSKQALYRALLRQLFTEAAAALRVVATDPELTPEQKIEGMVRAVAGYLEDHEHFPTIMLREVAESGAHLDARTLELMASLPALVGQVVAQGAEAGVFRRVHPVMAYFTLVAPIVLYMGGAPIRRALASQKLINIDELTTDAFVAQVQEGARQALLKPARTGRKS